MRKLPFLVIAAALACPASATAPEPVDTALTNSPLLQPLIGQARSLRSLTLGSYRLGI